MTNHPSRRDQGFADSKKKWRYIGIVAAKMRNYVDTSVTNDTACNYIVTASSSIVSGFSNEAYATASPWYSTGGSWTNRRMITVPSSSVTAGQTLANFPTPVSYTDSTLKTTSNEGRVGKTNGDDILFTNTTGVKLNHEVDEHNGSIGSLKA